MRGNYSTPENKVKNTITQKKLVHMKKEHKAMRLELARQFWELGVCPKSGITSNHLHHGYCVITR